MARTHRAAWLLVAAALGMAGASTGWWVTDRLEQDNDFCNACHLASGVALHREIRRDFDAAPAMSLAAAHAEAAGEPFRCIDCHGGVSFPGRVRVKALAAKDALVYLTGRFVEPDHMQWPLWDEDCSQCHASFVESDPEPGEATRFHQFAVHNVALGVDCVECHLSHEPVGDTAPYHLQVDHVRTECARCHQEFEEKPG